MSAEQDVLRWRVEQLEDRQKELERTMTTAIDGLRLAAQADHEKVQNRLHDDYLTRDQTKLQYVSKKDERYQSSMRHKTALLIVGILAGVSSVLAIIEQIRQAFG